MNNIFKAVAITSVVTMLSACGQQVEVPPASVGKIMTKDGYQEGTIPPSKFRLAACWAYCDKLVTIETSDKSYVESMTIFIPEDKLNLKVDVRTTLSLKPNNALFSAITPNQVNDYLAAISTDTVYTTYARQIIQAEAREYLSQFSISEIASSNEKINNDMRIRLSKVLEERTPFAVRYAGVTNIQYPKIITDAQEAAAERREAIQQEEAQLQISKVKLERELQEARMTRAIEKEKAETEAIAQRMLADSVDSRVLELRKLEIQREWVEKWNGQLPSTVLGENVPMVNLK